MKERKASVSDLTVDDLFHAAFSNDAVRICIVTARDDSTFTARALTTQEIFRFDRRSGVSIPFEADGAVCTIDSVAPLPDDIRDALLGYDRRCRTSKDPDAGRLTANERHALLDAQKLYEVNPFRR
ncbi:hypothetical protein LQG66_05565 [Bradyrhizobium ontarionense]|uniref:DUF1488 domain-containing protein n=1 Tax=Bradyrhizobium ontarionense TaxID=2898149 RepID=A0ABY3REC6_9BRAD|nr:hypothetical protein [Bradyrhizobium sp. A19]UFZ05780.1 hypothetical protein LQG66_05565 [Bradyrhizobium sp. A19]